LQIESFKEFKIIRVDGDLDQDSLVQEFDETVSAAFVTGEEKVAVDLSKTQYLPSRAIGTIMEAKKLTLETDGDIVLVSPTTELGEILDVVGLKKLVRIVDNKESL